MLKYIYNYRAISSEYIDTLQSHIQFMYLNNPSRDGKQDGAWAFQGRKNNRSTSQVSSNNRFKGNTNIVWCYKCGAGGHTSNLCRFSTPVECHKCHKLGHKYKFCHLYNKV